jgi:Protein of unknown function (DUF4012)
MKQGEGIVWIKRGFGLFIASTFILVTLFGLTLNSDLNSLKSELNSNSSKVKLTNATRALNRDMNLFFTLANLPVIKQVFDILSINFVPIRQEIRAVIEASPTLLGTDTPRKYLIAFQNSAEARGTGGIIGAFAIVKFERGKLSVERTGSNAMLKSLETLPIAMPTDFIRIYGNDPAIWQNSNISPHFPFGAKIWMALWEKQFGEKLDGVIAVDPSALSYILKSTGPITLNTGEVISGNNLVAETLEKAYKRYEFDNLARKNFLVRIINATASRFASGQYSKLRLAQGLERGIVENRILVYSTDGAVEKILESTKLSGALSASKKNEFRTVIINTDASKLDYYLSRRTQVKSLSCNKNGKVQIELSLTNTLKSSKGLPSYVLTRADKTKPAALVSGQHRFLSFIYGPPGSSLISAKRSTALGSPGRLGEELHRPVLVVDVDLAPHQSEKVTAVFSRGTGPITYNSQPLVIPEKVAIYDKCR